MEQPEATLFGIFLALYLPAYTLYHFMVFAANKQLPSDKKIPHSLFWGGWSRLRDEYRTFYPRSRAYDAAVGFSVACLCVALLLVVVLLLVYLRRVSA